MLKRSFMIVTLLGTMVPVAAIAGNISTRVMTAGGTATMGSGAAQTSAAGTVTKFFGTGKYYNTAGVLVPQVDAGTTVAFAADSAAGYVVSEVKLNGVVQPLTTPVTVPAAAKGQSVTIKFARQTVSVTANAAAGGSVIPGGTKSGVVGTALTYVFTPFAGAKVQTITASGLPSYTLTDAVTHSVISGLPYAGPVAMTFTPVANSNVTITPSFLAITASAGANQTIVAGNPATLVGTSSASGATFAWTQVGGPALFLGSNPWTAGIAGPTTPSLAAGNYTFQVTATSGTTTATSVVLVQAITGYKALTTLQTVKNQCVNCHNASTVGGTSTATSAAGVTPVTYSFTPDVYNSYSASANKTAGTLCTVCHVGAFTGAHPGVATNQDGTTHKSHNLACNLCHHDATGTNGDAHNKTQADSTGCVDCHAVAQNAGATYVQENNSGVRAILGANSEFAKKSHHIFNGVGLAPTNAQCVACHLEGKVAGGAIAVDTAYHMADNKIHLRNAHDDTDLEWDPQAATSMDHTNMDNFCMSCHSATGATSPMSAQIQAYLIAHPAFTGAPNATATNPFGDLVSNSYDKQSRVKVVDVDSQFNTDNFSHHAVKGKKYSTRNSAILVAAWKSYSSAGGHSTDETVPGSPRFNASTQKTLYDGGLLGFNGTAGTKYVPLDQSKAGATVGDDSQLHCGDCHTVGQWKVGSSTNADKSPTTAVIGAHGSVNEYMLRNTKGTDALNGLGTFICYNCHNDQAGGNTSGGYYSGAYWNNTTGKWVTAGNLHLSIHGGGSSVQYGGASGCIQNSAGLAYTDFSSAVHNNISWRSSWATPATSRSFLIGSGGVAANNITYPFRAYSTAPTKVLSSQPKFQGGKFSGYSTVQVAVTYSNTNPPVTTNGDSAIILQSVLNGTQYVYFDASGNFAGIYSNMASNTGTPVGSATSGNGNTANKATGSGITGHNPVDLVFDADGTVIDPSFFTGTGRNHFVGGNIFGNGCMNCHNVGRTGFGGIHGGSNVYTTGYSTSNHGIAGQAAVVETQSTYRFMPGLGNYGYVPAGSGKEEATYTANPATGAGTLAEGATVKVTGKSAWEAWNGIGTSTEGGCYTNDYAKQNAGWSGCNHHGNGGGNDGGPGGTQPAGFGNGEPPTKSQAAGQVGRTLNY